MKLSSRVQVESHDSIGFGESYHASLCPIYEKKMDEKSKIDLYVALWISIKAMNDSIGPKRVGNFIFGFQLYSKIFFPDTALLINIQGQNTLSTLERKWLVLWWSKKYVKLLLQNLTQ